MGVAGAGARSGSWERPLPPSDWVGEPPTCFIAISERGEKGRRREPPRRRRRRPRDRHGSARGQIVRPGSKEGSGVDRPVAALPPAGAGAGGATFTSVPPPPPSLWVASATRLPLDSHPSSSSSLSPPAAPPSSSSSAFYFFFIHRPRPVDTQ